jgi:arginyl-tRNA synthetase
MEFHTLLTKLTNQVIAEHGFQNIETDKIQIESPADLEHGDYSTNAALVLFGQLKKSNALEGVKSPKQLAEKLALSFEQILAKDENNFVDKVSVAGPGFINFSLSDDFLIQELQTIISEQGDVISQSGKDKSIIAEYSSPNIAKPFTIGHLRSTIIGDAVANILESLGWKVYRDNHLGDWGTQFGKQIFAIKTWGDEKEIDNSDRPVKLLVELYVKFHQQAEIDSSIEDQGRLWFKKLEDGDPEARRIWQKCINWSLKEFDEIYSKLGVKFTENEGKGYGESFFEDKMESVIDELKNKDLLKKSQGAELVFFPDDLFPPLMILKKDGATLYSTRDLATDKFRLEKYGQDIIITNETGSEQALYWKQLFKVEEMLGWYNPAQRSHIRHGLIRFEDKKMSTRKGNVIWLEDVLQEAFKRVEKQAQGRVDDESIWKIAIGALKINDLKRDPVKNVVFDWDDMLSLQGVSGPYLQYTYVRSKSVLKKAEQSGLLPKLSVGSQNPVQLSSNELAVLKLLHKFSYTVVNAGQLYQPHHLVHYLFSLAQAYSNFYTNNQILKEPDEDLRIFRLNLTQATSLVIAKGLSLLGVQTVEKM